MELPINIKVKEKVGFFVKLLEEFEYIEILSIKENETSFNQEHKKPLDERLKRIENGETNFKSRNEIKSKYEKKAI